MLDIAIPRANAAWRRSIFIMAMTALGACGDTTAARVASTVNAASGNNQTVTANAAATAPLVVTVYDQNGSVMSGVTVSWSIVAGTGALSGATSTTDANGQASVEFTAGGDVGDITVDAVVTGLDAVPFTITVTDASS